MQAHIHIGHHKTGTTSLQAFMSGNAARFLREGTLYPWVEPEGAALLISALLPLPSAPLHQTLKNRLMGRRPAVVPVPAPPAPSPMNMREAHNALAFSMLADAKGWKMPKYHANLPSTEAMLNAITQQIRVLAPRHLVICSEVMSQFGISAPDQIVRLAEAVGPCDRHLWCTLRRPDEQAVSWHGQMVRFGNAPKPLSAPDGSNLGWLHFDYRRVVEPWITRLSECRVTLRPYAATLAAGGSVKDFLTLTGIGNPDGVPEPKRLNVSRAPAVTALLREANASMPREKAREMAENLSGLARKLSLATASEVELIGAVNRQRMFDAFRPIHDWLTQQNGGAPFFGDLDQMLTCLPIPEVDAVADFLDKLAPHLDTFEDHDHRAFLSQKLAKGPRQPVATAGNRMP